MAYSTAVGGRRTVQSAICLQAARDGRGLTLNSSRPRPGAAGSCEGSAAASPPRFTRIPAAFPAAMTEQMLRRTARW